MSAQVSSIAHTARVITTGVLIFGAAVLLSCTRERPLAPKPVVGPQLHERWEDQEAEELALWLSGDVIAPRLLYDRVKSDLAQIRAKWGDSLPVLRDIHYLFPAETGWLTVEVQDTTKKLILSGQYHDFDGLNNLYGLSSVEQPQYSSRFLTFHFTGRLNPCYLAPLYDSLSGFCFVGLNGRFTFSGQSIRACRDGDSILYIFEESYCGGFFGCKPYRYFVFRSLPGNLLFVGQQLDHADSTSRPDWWPAVVGCLNDEGFCASDRMHQRIDWLPPARVTDLRVLEPQVGQAAKVVFTTPGDDGIEGSCAEITLAASYVPLTDSNWNSAPYLTQRLGGGPGDEERVAALTALSGTEASYVAVRAADCRNNWSPVSDNVRLENRWLGGWTSYRTNNSSLPNDRITSLRMAPDGRLWVGTQSGLATLKDGAWTIYTSSNSGIAGDWINGIDGDSHGVIWIGTADGLSSYDGMQWASYEPPSGAIPSKTISHLSAGADGAIWCGLSGALGKFAHGSWNRYEPQAGGLSGSAIMAVIADDNGAVWVGTNSGLNRFDGAGWSLYNPTDIGIGGRSVQSIFQDHTGAIWCGSYNGQISRLATDSWVIVSDDGKLPTSSYAELGDVIWIGTRQWLWRYDGSWQPFSAAITALQSDNITALAAEGDHVLWIGTGDAGLYRWDLKAAGLAGTMAQAAVSIP
jgi:hypothetical protein